MAVTLPKVDRIAPQAPASTGRVQGEAPNMAAPIAAVGKSLEGIGAATVDYFAIQEKAASDDAKLAVVNRFNERAIILRDGGTLKDAAGNDEKILGARNTQGDPTEVYKDYDDRLAKFRDELLSSGEGWSDRTKAAVTRGLNEAYNDVRLKNLSYEGSQYAQYRKDVTDTAAKNMYGDVMDSTIYMNAADPKSFAPFDESISKIRNLRIAE
ncbi:MAG: hypothetical protein ACRCV5_22710, partial [Afipia sp.]